MPSFEQQLQNFLEVRPYRPETIEYVNRVCHVGRVSCQTALEFLEKIEADHTRTDGELAGISLEWE